MGCKACPSNPSSTTSPSSPSPSSWVLVSLLSQPTLEGSHPRPLMSTGQRQRTLETTWATTRPGNSNGSTHLARTTKRSLLIEWRRGRSTTGSKCDEGTKEHKCSLLHNCKGCQTVMVRSISSTSGNKG